MSAPCPSEWAGPWSERGVVHAVQDDCNLLAVLGCENVVEQCGLPSAEIACDIGVKSECQVMLVLCFVYLLQW